MKRLPRFLLFSAVVCSASVAYVTVDILCPFNSFEQKQEKPVHLKNKSGSPKRVLVEYFDLHGNQPGKKSGLWGLKREIEHDLRNTADLYIYPKSKTWISVYFENGDVSEIVINRKTKLPTKASIYEDGVAVYIPKGKYLEE